MIDCRRQTKRDPQQPRGKNGLNWIKRFDKTRRIVYVRRHSQRSRKITSGSNRSCTFAFSTTARLVVWPLGYCCCICVYARDPNPAGSSLKIRGTIIYSVVNLGDIYLLLPIHPPAQSLSKGRRTFSEALYVDTVPLPQVSPSRTSVLELTTPVRVVQQEHEGQRGRAREQAHHVVKVRFYGAPSNMPPSK